VKALETKHTSEVELRGKAEARALQTDKASKINEILNGFDFATPDARTDAFELLEPMIVRSEDGALISKKENLPFDTFIQDFLPGKKAYLLSASKTKGSGATGTPGFKAGSKQIGLEDIKAGMTNEELTAVLQSITSALPKS
jgi:hypothetical protein